LQHRAFPESFQFDCDWTEQTRDKYFSFLARIKENLKKEINNSSNQKLSISATLRLHQLKYAQKTGVPPVDRGMLMLYNTGKIDDWDTENSILSIETLQEYFRGIEHKYPLTLDFVLPIFQWALVFRDGQLWKIINNLTSRELEDSSRFIQIQTGKQHNIRFEVRKSTFLDGYYLIKGDKIKLESVNPTLLKSAVALLKGEMGNFSNFDSTNPALSFEVAFYYLEENLVMKFPQENIKEILEQF
jgi:hypothetical protein